jgi:hypothetical protein
LRLKCSSLTQSVSEGEEAKKQGIMFGMSFAHSHNVAICSLVVLVERDVVVVVKRRSLVSSMPRQCRRSS